MPPVHFHLVFVAIHKVGVGVFVQIQRKMCQGIWVEQVVVVQEDEILSPRSLGSLVGSR